MTATGMPTRDILSKTPFHYNRIAGRGLERLCALSDGLFAIAMTLIVLEIHVPSHLTVRTEAALWASLVALGPRISTYLLSFLTLGIFWVGQQTQLGQFSRTDRHLTWIHLAWLSLVAIMPFSTGLLAEFTTFRLALLLYWANIALLGAIGARAGGANVIRATARVTFWGALAMALTAGIGALVGTAI